MKKTIELEQDEIDLIKRLCNDCILKYKDDYACQLMIVDIAIALKDKLDKL